MKILLRIVCRILFRIEIHGNTNLPATRKLLVIANHESFLDGLLLGLFLTFRATFVVHTAVLENPVFRFLLFFTPYLTVDPTKPLVMKKIIKLLEVNEPVVIFPEGRTTMTGNIIKLYDCLGFVAAKTGASILPVRLDGIAQSYFSRLSSNYPRSIFPKITLTILHPTSIAMSDAPSAKLRRHMAGESMRRIIQEMIFASQPVQTLFSALLDAIKIHGRNTSLLEDAMACTI